MLVYGTANPAGYGGDDYTGLYLTDRDLDRITPTIVGTPVKIEHKARPAPPRAALDSALP